MTEVRKKQITIYPSGAEAMSNREALFPRPMGFRKTSDFMNNGCVLVLSNLINHLYYILSIICINPMFFCRKPQSLEIDTLIGW